MDNSRQTWKKGNSDIFIFLRRAFLGRPTLSSCAVFVALSADLTRGSKTPWLYLSTVPLVGLGRVLTNRFRLENGRWNRVPRGEDFRTRKSLPPSPSRRPYFENCHFLSDSSFSIHLFQEIGQWRRKRADKCDGLCGACIFASAP